MRKHMVLQGGGGQLGNALVDCCHSSSSSVGLKRGDVIGAGMCRLVLSHFERAKDFI